VTTVNNGNNSRTNITATCPAGKTLIGGGAHSSTANAYVTNSSPATVTNGKATTWTADGTEVSNVSNWDLTVYAICATDQ
jgi:hypothetical protein